jgi:hypothetical protein
MQTRILTKPPSSKRLLNSFSEGYDGFSWDEGTVATLDAS